MYLKCDFYLKRITQPMEQKRKRKTQLITDNSICFQNPSIYEI